MPSSQLKRSQVSLYQLLGYGCVFCLVLFLLTTGPPLSSSEKPLQFGGVNSKKTESLLAAGEPLAEVPFALQELYRMRCLRDIQQKLFEDFRPYFEGSNKKVVLMDVALHANLGDNILWKAAMDLIAAFGISADIVCYLSQKGFVDAIDAVFHVCDLHEIAETVKDGGLVLLHAGGNWGDLYRYVHQGRLEYLKELSENARNMNFTVLQLPQSVAYTPGSEFLAADDALINEMEPDSFVFAAREQDGFDFAQSHYPAVDSFLTIDIAFALGPMLPSHAATIDVFIQMRQDVEVVKSDEGQFEWLEEKFQAANMTFNYRDWWYHPQDHTEEISATIPTLLGDVRLNAAVNLISNAKIIITNRHDRSHEELLKLCVECRLHGSIVASLLGKHIFMVDTVEGKLRRVHDVRRAVSSNCRDENLHIYPCSSLREAVVGAIELHSQPGTVYN